MKNWLNERQLVLQTLFTGLICAIVYRNSFISPFFQDDKFHLLLASRNNPFEIITNFPYRPISLQLFYSFSNWIFNGEVFGFHLILFFCSLVSFYFVLKIAKLILKDSVSSFVATFVYALNISMFANFYWVAISYFVFASLFLFPSFYFFIKGSKLSYTSIILFILALLSNEISVVFPLILLAFTFIYDRSKFRKTFPYILFGGLFLLFRYFLVGLPESSDYSIVVNSQAISTVRWYVLRATNLPEGVNRVDGIFIWILWILQITILLIATLKNKYRDVRLISFGIIWFLLAALPFFFLPKHMSSYYLTVSLLGTSLIIGSLFKRWGLAILFCLVYLALSITGLDFLSQTHWIILKNTGPIGKF